MQWESDGKLQSHVADRGRVKQRQLLRLNVFYFFYLLLLTKGSLSVIVAQAEQTISEAELFERREGALL